MRSDRHPGFPKRPTLRPGVHVCRREDGRIQIGLAEHLAVTAPDTAEVATVLEGLRNCVPPGPVATLGHDVRRLCADLLDRELVLDADALLVTLGTVRPGERRESLSAFFCDRGALAPALLDQRGAASATISHRGLPGAAERLGGLLEEAGVGGVSATGVAVHLSRGEPERERFDDWLRDDLPHVLLTVSEGEVRAGPFVVPGRTACVRCLDAHQTDRDPRWPLVLAQYSSHGASRDALPEPIHHDLVEMAVLWLARDVTNWLDGARPRTWSSTVVFDTGLQLGQRRWSQHPSCGCGWAQAAAG